MPNTIADNLSRLVTAKTNIANAIIEMGGTVNDGDGFESFPADIATIPSGGSSKDFLLPKPSVLSKFTSTWSTKTWTGLTSFYGNNVWTDGNNIYYSSGSSGSDIHYVLNKETSTWSTKIWKNVTPSSGYYIWTSGSLIYCSNGSIQYRYFGASSGWAPITWYGNLTSFYGSSVWTDGTNTYYSSGSSQYVLNAGSDSWASKTWTGLTSFEGGNVWTDGNNIYYSNSSHQYVLGKTTVTHPTTKCVPGYI